MATATKTTQTEKPARKTVSLVDRTKAQLSAATLKNKIRVEELGALETHIGKLKSLLA
jgi:hypothetical protein